MVKDSDWHLTARVCTLLLAVGSLAVCVVSTNVAGQYYRWVDSSGNLYIGDQPPPAGAVGTSRLPIPEYAPLQPSPEDDPYSILNQTKRLEEQRQALVRQREEKRRAEREFRLRKRELEAAAAPPLQQPVPVYVYPQIFYGRPGRRPWHPRPHDPEAWSGGQHAPQDRYQAPRPKTSSGTIDRRLYLGQ